MQENPEHYQNILLILLCVIILIILIVVFIKSSSKTDEEESKEDYFNSININDDKEIDNLITNNEDSISDLLTKKIIPPKKNTTKITVIDVIKKSVIQIKHTSPEHSSINIDSNQLKINFDKIFFNIALLIDKSIKKIDTIEKTIFRYKNDKNYSKKFFITDTDNSNSLEILLQFYNKNIPEIITYSDKTSTQVLNYTDTITTLINSNIIQKEKKITETVDNLINIVTKKDTKKQHSLNKFLENINESINQSLLKASNTHDRKHFNIAKKKMQFRALFLETNNLLIKNSKDFLIIKKIKNNKIKLDKLYKNILSSRTT